MTLKDFAKTLDGIDGYPTSSNIKTAKENGIVIVYGMSDDLVEFEGAYTEEAGGVFDGGIVTFDMDGTSDDGNTHENTLKAYWCGMIDGEKVRDYTATWEYETSIPHETFKMQDGDELYCIGLVFYKKDMRG